MTNLATFIQDSAYPGKTLSLEGEQLIIEGVGPVSVGRIRELDAVGQLQWETEEMRRLAYSIEQPAPQTAQPAQPAPQEPAEESSSGIFGTIIAIVAVIAIIVLAYVAISSFVANQPEDPPVDQQQSQPEPESQPEPQPEPEEPSDETT